MWWWELVVTQKILVVDDEIDAQELTRSLLEAWDYRVLTAFNGADALEIATRERPELILLDVHLGDVDGPEVCEKLRESFATRFIPVIMLTVDDLVRRKIEGLGKGADDYLLKTIDPLELKARVETLIRRTLEQSNVNPLTKLPGNVVIEKFVQERVANNSPFSVCYCDLDNFKSYNDRYGYAAGDRILLHTARLLVETITRVGGAGDFVGHVGGDDFVLVTTPDKEEVVSSEIMRAFDASIEEFYNAEDRSAHGIHVSARDGVVQRFPIMTITIAAVNNEKKTLENHRIIAERAAEIKTYLKRFEGSNFLSDRRGPDEKRRRTARVAPS